MCERASETRTSPKYSWRASSGHEAPEDPRASGGRRAVALGEGLVGDGVSGGAGEDARAERRARFVEGIARRRGFGFASFDAVRGGGPRR